MGGIIIILLVLLVIIVIMNIAKSEQEMNSMMITFYFSIVVSVVLGVGLAMYFETPPQKFTYKVVQRMKADSTVVNDTTYFFKNCPVEFNQK
jgi:UDP-N-acetylmuramyl pentapeptide phosphotransferase/UDP-N-acetylglucosamine-1-phosphate transferase